MNTWDVIIIGAGAAGLMCAAEAGKRQRRVLVLDHANKVGKKILMSGGGRCNFTNYYIEPRHYISENAHFCISALKRYTSSDFIALVKSHGIPFHEKSHGQLFCDNKAVDIVNMLLEECQRAQVKIELHTKIANVERKAGTFRVQLTTNQVLHCQSLVVATGGLSIPTMGASPFGYQLASQFGLEIIPTRAALVPFTLQPDDKNKWGELSGISLPAKVHNDRQTFHLDFLFTHRGLSGPAILQISSYWQPGEEICIDFDTTGEWIAAILHDKKQRPNMHARKWFEALISKRVVAKFFTETELNKELHLYSDKDLISLVQRLKQFRIKPNGTEGYRTAEVTLGGVDTTLISSQTMEVKTIPGLYFIGEVLDVTGWLGGFNFQWAWSSGWAAGQVV